MAGPDERPQGAGGSISGADGKDVRRTGDRAEAAYGFAQAVRWGDTIHISGQTASRGDGGVDGPGDLPTQLAAAYAKVRALLESYGADMGNVVEETIFVTDMAAAVPGAIGVRRDAYGEHLDVASTLVEVKGLAVPELLVEVSCVARLGAIHEG